MLAPPTGSAVVAASWPSSAVAGGPPPSSLSPAETLDSPASSAVRLRSCEQLELLIYQIKSCSLARNQAAYKCSLTQ